MTTDTGTQLDVQIRWLIRRDMPDVLAIESSSFRTPWTDEDFLCCLRQLNCIGMVAESWNVVRGYMIYELHKGSLELLNIAVKPDVRLRGVGRQMIDKLTAKINQRRREINVRVRETNLDAQLFFRACGFRAIGVSPGHYEDTGEDCYLMRYSVPLDDLI